MSWFSAAVDSRLKVAVSVIGERTDEGDVGGNNHKEGCEREFPLKNHGGDPKTQRGGGGPRPDGERGNVVPASPPREK